MLSHTSEGLARTRTSSLENRMEDATPSDVYEMRDWLWNRVVDAAEDGIHTLVIELPENAPGRRRTIRGLGGLPQRIPRP